jgi:pyrroloquinoline quinone (PQQ) biosynthesis protein C
LLEALRGGADVEDALTMADAPDAARNFVHHTFSCIEQKQLHKVAAAFTFGREDLIPDMFRGFVRDLDRAMAGKLDMFVWYLERHIEVDGEEHGPMALRMVASLCGEEPKRWQEAAEAAESALQARLDLWDGILQSILESSAEELEKSLGFSSLTPK